MAKNPMQRKAQNSFILGMLLTLVITGLIIAFLFMQLTNTKKEMKQLEDAKVEICVINTDVKSGQVITEDMVQTMRVNRNTIPSNAIGNDASRISTYTLEDPSGNGVGTENGELYITVNNAKRIIEQQGDNFYYKDTNEKVELTTAPIIAKVDMSKNTILTGSLIARSDEKITNDVRKMEYSVIGLPTQIETDKYIDIRLRMPSGGDYIVVSHKKIEVPEVDGVPSSNTLWVNLSEDEILTMSCAIVESYQIQGSRLYATEYVEPGSQKAAVKTYIPNSETYNLIVRDPNCVEEAQQALAEMYNDNEKRQVFRDPIQNNVNNNSEDAIDSVIEKTQEEIQKTQQERQSYLESLGGGN